MKKIIESESYIGEEADLVISFTALPGQRFIMTSAAILASCSSL
jgi:hypothetical protein